MEIVALQFALCGLNLLGAKSVKENGGNPMFNYFVAGMTFGFGISKLIEIYLK
jgi:hypothetical protein